VFGDFRNFRCDDWDSLAPPERLHVLGDPCRTCVPTIALAIARILHCFFLCGFVIACDVLWMFCVCLWIVFFLCLPRILHCVWCVFASVGKVLLMFCVCCGFCVFVCGCVFAMFYVCFCVCGCVFELFVLFVCFCV